jgi:hypothetical protein
MQNGRKLYNQKKDFIMKTSLVAIAGIASVILVLSGCAPKPEKPQDNIIVSLNLNLNQQKAAGKFPKNPEELQAGVWTYNVIAEKWRQSYFPANADVQIKYLVAHATTIIVEGRTDTVLDYTKYLQDDMGSAADIVQLFSQTKPKNVVSLTFIKTDGKVIL